MKILGVANTIDSGACLILDGVLVSCVNEERFTRIKSTRGFPVESISYLLEEHSLSVSDIDIIACSAWAGLNEFNTLSELTKDIIEISKQGNFAQSKVLERIQSSCSSIVSNRAILEENLVAMGFQLKNLIYVNHHEGHALTSFIPSPFDKSLIFVADGRGDYMSMSLWEADRRSNVASIKLVNQITELKSLGAMYGFITNILGFTPHKHEGKVTGLAASGEKTDFYDFLKSGIDFCVESGEFTVQYGGFYLPFISSFPDELKSMAGLYRPEDVAWAAQELLESCLTQYLTYHLKRLGIVSTNLCLSGGIMANVKSNMILAQLPQIENVFIAPSMGDGGSALGGALKAMLLAEDGTQVNLKNSYLGPEYDTDEIKEELDLSSINYTVVNIEDIPSEVSRLLQNNQTVGLFQGRMEYGPRALGNRSILANPSNPNINASLNQRLNRTEFMPFAPATISELAKDCFVGWELNHQSPKFMTICYQCTPYFAKLCPATVHLDNTARPQIVFKDENPLYHSIIKEFYNLTGIPGIINTSFNHHEEPIVMSPRDAVRSFLKGNVDALLIGPYLVSK
ncbi:MAG: hypothetical protein EB127_17705 [Alphaproteobacteria bacterium]|nr:hypothetical protein [Alphaproteobacteria bacterium]